MRIIIYIAGSLDDHVQGMKYQILSPMTVIESKATNVSKKPNPIDTPLLNTIDTQRCIMYRERLLITIRENSISQSKVF